MQGGMSNVGMDPDKFKSTMTSINQGTVMAAAARNLQKEMLRQQAERPSDPSRAVVDMHDLEQARGGAVRTRKGFDHLPGCAAACCADPAAFAREGRRAGAAAPRPHRADEGAECAACMARSAVTRSSFSALSAQREAEKRAAMATKGHGEYQEVSEGEFLPAVTGSSHVVVHFYHNEFERCRILDKHLTAVAKKYFRTRFVKVHAPDAPFFVTKLAVKVLPCVIMFLEGKAYDRIVGFDEFGTRDDFNTAMLEQRLLTAGVVAPPERGEDDSDDEEERRTALSRIMRQGGRRDSDDEDSDFE